MTAIRIKVRRKHQWKKKRIVGLRGSRGGRVKRKLKIGKDKRRSNTPER